MNHKIRLACIFFTTIIGLVLFTGFVFVPKPLDELLSLIRLRSVSLKAGVATDWLERIPFLHGRQLHEQANAAWQRADWASCIELFSELRGLEADDPTVVSRLGMAHLLYANRLIQADQLRAALIHFEAAKVTLPPSALIDSMYRLVGEYQMGRESYQRGEWTSSIRHFEQVYKLDPSFNGVKRRLFDAIVQEGFWQQRMGHALQARWQYENALRLYPEDIQVRSKLAEATQLLTKPDRRIIVSISQQRMYLYENGQSVQTWSCSTGEIGRGTKPGHYKVETRLDMAYASAWGLDMPYWLGIYYAGPTENGIHAPPIIRATGQKMWDGLIGYPVSFGCIILSDENAKALYEWAPYNTPVDVMK